MSESIRSFGDLRVFQGGMEAAMEIFELSKGFPPEEKYSLTDQMRKASGSVCINIGEAWRKPRQGTGFIAKISDAEGEACETQVWQLLWNRCRYPDEPTAERLFNSYEMVLAQLTKMITGAGQWTIRSAEKSPPPPSRDLPVSASPRRGVPLPRQEA